MKNIFTEHPRSVNETYWKHLKFAFYFGFNMLVAGIAGIIHAFLPNLFQKTGSHCLLKLMSYYIKRMPKLEEGVLAIGQLIETKRLQAKKE